MINKYKWLWVRIFIYMVSFVSGFYNSTNPVEIKNGGSESLVELLAITLGALAFPIVVIISVSVSSSLDSTTYSGKWEHPNHMTNFCRLRDPLHLIHLTVYSYIFSMLAANLKFFFYNHDFDVKLLILLVAGIYSLISIRLIQKFFKGKYI
jgi:hypothetical protein